MMKNICIWLIYCGLIATPLIAPWIIADSIPKLTQPWKNSRYNSLCQKDWFLQDWDLYQSPEWKSSYANHFGGYPIQTMKLKGTPFPYYRYDITLTNVSIEFLYRIEVPDYPTEVKNWIPQLINGTTVDCGHPNKEQCPQWLSFSFYPTPFEDRDVCQIYCPITRLTGGKYVQVAFRTVPFKNCHNFTKDSPKEMIHMDEHIAKFFQIKETSQGTQIHYTYLGMENPRGNFPVWFMELTYPWAYKSHVSNFIRYVEENGGVVVNS